MEKILIISLVFIFLIAFFQINILADPNKNTFIFSPFPGFNYPYDSEQITCAIGIFGLILPSFNGFASSLLFNTIEDYSEGVGFAILFQSYLKGFTGSVFTLGFNFIGNNYQGFQIGVLANFNFGEFNGIQVGFVNYNSNYARGFQIGFLNLNMTQFEGYSLGLASFSKRNVGPLMISVFTNFIFSDFTGFQASIFNFSTANVTGFQVGLVNFNLRDFDGFRIGLFAYSRYFNGVQIGLINISKEFDGFQFGLINITRTSKGFSMGLFNFFKNGYNRIETTYNELNISKLNLKWGDRRLYNVIGFGMDSSQQNFQSSFGFGTHFDFGLCLDIEFLIIGNSNIDNLKYYLSRPYNMYGQSLYYYDYYGSSYYSESYIPLALAYLILGDTSSFTLRLNLTLPLGFIEIIGGITYNLGFKLDPATGVFSWYKPEEIVQLYGDLGNYTFFKYAWFGFSIGVQFKI